MFKKFDFHRFLVLTTCFVAILVVIGILWLETIRLPDPVSINTERQPTLGDPNAPVHLVIFEDFNCKNCKNFSLKVFPSLKSQYIDQGLVKYTMISLAFIRGSKPVANAALCIYELNPKLFFSYVEKLYALSERDRNWATHQKLINAAMQIEEIDIGNLRRCLESKKYIETLSYNLDEARRVMGEDFGTPTLYIDGVPISDMSYRAISKRIDQALSQRKNR